MSRPVCLVTGVGDGTGAAIVRRFAQSNYQVAMVARNGDRLSKQQTFKVILSKDTVASSPQSPQPPLLGYKPLLQTSPAQSFPFLPTQTKH